MKKMSHAFAQLICGTKTNAKKNTGIRKKENGKRSSCMVDGWMIKRLRIS